MKTPHPHVVEVLALSPLDALVLDAEHAPFGREVLDQCILAARAESKTVLVRPSANDPSAILQALDGGSDGVVIPHIRSRVEAKAAVRACHYKAGGRGFAGSSRAAGFTTLGMAAHREAAQNVIVIAQIEDAEALVELDDIVRVPGLNAIFVGRADLTVSLGAESPDDQEVVAAIERICEVCRRADMPIGMFLSRSADVPIWTKLGATLFVLRSDQDFLLKGARSLHADIHG
ncbi:MAG: aldolase/citrate lyase family protein [Pontixanthobacter sp.]